MKKGLLSWYALSILVAGAGTAFFSSCSDNDDSADNAISPEEAELNEYFKYDASQIEVVEDTTFNILDEMRKRIQNKSNANSETKEDTAMLEYYKAQYDRIQAFAERTADSIFAVEPGNSLEAITGQILEMGRAVISYDDIGADGKTKRMSMLVVYPTRFFVNIDAKNIILGCHYTITDNNERPTATGFQGLNDACFLGAEWATTENYLVVMPDYEGFGSSVDSKQPYLIREVQARQCIKALNVAINWFKNDHGEEFSDGRVVVEGFSQGGAVAAATYRYWLEHINDNWARSFANPIVGAVCADGPYDPLATLEYYCKNNWLSMPVAPALMLLGLCETDKDAIKAGLKPSDFFSESFCNSGIFERINKKIHPTTHCEYALGDNPGSMKVTDHTKVSASDAFKKEVFEFFRDGKQPTDNPELLNKLNVLKNCLMKNRLFDNFDLKPSYVLKAKIGSLTGTHNYPTQFTFFHGLWDTVVPYDNIISVGRNWGFDNIKVVQFQNYFDHGDVGRSFFLEIHDDLVHEILDNKWSPGVSQYQSSLF